jgi:hypothetical protein
MISSRAFTGNDASLFLATAGAATCPGGALVAGGASGSTGRGGMSGAVAEVTSAPDDGVAALGGVLAGADVVVVVVERGASDTGAG